MSYSPRLQDIPASERPRERLVEIGAKYLSNAELLAILIGSGDRHQGLSAIGLAQLILQTFSQGKRDPFDILRSANPQELTNIQGVGPAKAAQILAGIELGKRVFQAKPREKVIIDSPEAAAIALSNDLMWQEQERFAVLCLDVKNKLIATKVITIGLATETLAHPREVFREVIKQGAARIIIAHNHPSGSLEASNTDLQLTERLLQAAQIIGIPLMDHLILGHDNFSSLRQNCSLWDDYPQPE
ncbi:DNA replication and repair protein RadC [[Leptolyngbya] sp. PCC 7376]|uniref:RadC family protein n=1 Tax=[Leptolyngbya] sp. PCC 7376 TaxID=111781 RepID=UPI00029ED0E8|nr:DNA repair protein RadC [[Leptolyngbya] sp. PCC 7376]AFY36853.1 DNA replication and repair protein RadC [[Leptolyngbya] sp. PCC 7376]